MSLLVVGSVAFDTVKTSQGAAEEVLGGSATYCAYAASFFTPVWLVSPVGEDMPPEHLADMRRHNIDTTGVKIVEGGDRDKIGIVHIYDSRRFGGPDWRLCECADGDTWNRRGDLFDIRGLIGV